MLRIGNVFSPPFTIATALGLLLLLPGPSAGAGQAEAKTVTAGTSTAKAPRVVIRKKKWDYGFLPGYTPPPSQRQTGEPTIPPWRTYHYWYGRTWTGYPIGSYGTGGYGGMWYRGRFSNGLGPCYTRTPIGPMWNCG